MKKRAKNVVINALKTAMNVEAPEISVRMLSKKTLSAADGPMQAFTFSARPVIEEKTGIECCAQMRGEDMMDEAIAQRRHGDHAALGIGNKERAIRPVAIATGGKFIGEPRKFRLQIKGEGIEFMSPVFATPEALPMPKECWYAEIHELGVAHHHTNVRRVEADHGHREPHG